MRRLAFISLLLGIAPSALLAHGEGVLRLASSRAAAGESVAFRGTGLPKSSSLRAELRGVLATLPLSGVRTDTAGNASGAFRLPTGAKPGMYTIVFLAPDGDPIARAEVEVIAATMASQMPGGMDHPAGADMPAGDMPAAEHVTAEPMDLPTRTTPVEWAMIAAVTIGAAGGGLGLLRRKTVPPGEYDQTAPM